MIKLTFAIVGSFMGMAICSCGEDSPEVTTKEEQTDINFGDNDRQPEKNRTEDVTPDQPGTSSEDNESNDNPETPDGSEVFPETDHLFSREDIITKFGAEGGVKTIEFNKHPRPQFNAIVTDSPINDERYRIAQTDLHGEPSWYIKMPEDNLDIYNRGDVVNSWALFREHRMGEDYSSARKELLEKGVRFVDIDPAEVETYTVTAGIDDWFEATIDYPTHSVKLTIKPNSGNTERQMTLVLEAGYRMFAPTSYCENAICIIQSAK